MQCPRMKENEASSTSFKYQTVKVLMITVWLVLFFFENVCVRVCVSSWKNMILVTAAAEDVTKTTSGTSSSTYMCVCVRGYIFSTCIVWPMSNKVFVRVAILLATKFLPHYVW